MPGTPSSSPLSPNSPYSLTNPAQPLSPLNPLGPLNQLGQGVGSVVAGTGCTSVPLPNTPQRPDLQTELVLQVMVPVIVLGVLALAASRRGLYV